MAAGFSSRVIGKFSLQRLRGASGAGCRPACSNRPMPAAVRPMHVTVAPGGRHMAVRDNGEGQIVVVLNDQPPENGCRPAGDFPRGFGRLPVQRHRRHRDRHGERWHHGAGIPAPCRCTGHSAGRGIERGVGDAGNRRGRRAGRPCRSDEGHPGGGRATAPLSIRPIPIARWMRLDYCLIACANSCQSRRCRTGRGTRQGLATTGGFSTGRHAGRC